MEDRNADLKEEERTSLSIVQGHVASLAKDLAFYTGTIYVIGFLVTAARLAAYGVASVELVNAQYLVAGLMPGVLGSTPLRGTAPIVWRWMQTRIRMHLLAPFR